MTQITTRPASRIADAVGPALQDTLIELLDLALSAKQAHWMVRGSHFRSLHLQLDEMVTEYRVWADLAAERAVALDVPVDGRAACVASRTPFEAFPAGWVRDDDVIDRFVERLGGAIGRLRERLDQTETEPVTQDLLMDVTRGLEKQRWMLKAQRS